MKTKKPQRKTLSVKRLQKMAMKFLDTNAYGEVSASKVIQDFLGFVDVFKDEV